MAQGFFSVPELPPAPGLGPTVEQWDRLTGNVVLWSVFVGLGCAAILGGLLSGNYVLFIPAAVAVPVGGLQVLSARRTCLAIGTDWLYARVDAWGDGRWARLDELTAAYIKTGRNFSYLHIDAGTRQIARLSTTADPSVSPFFPALGKALLDLPLTLNAETQDVLRRWAQRRP